MQRRSRIGQVWNWLPAFRAVAETQHLPSAAEEVHLSTSALSRAVRSLEDQLERPLFRREGRQLVLSPAGALMLTAVRDAMRRIDDGLAVLESESLVGPLSLSAPGPYASIFVLPAIERLVDQHPDLQPQVESVSPREVSRKLLAGSLDLALVDDPVAHEDLTVHLLGSLTDGIYTGRGHPLFGRHDALLEEILHHPFVGPPPGLRDHWPPHLERTLGMTSAQLHVAVQACASGRWLAFLPDAVAEAYTDGELFRFSHRMGPARPLYAVHRPYREVPNRVALLRDALEDSVVGASRTSLRGSIRAPRSGIEALLHETG